MKKIINYVEKSFVIKLMAFVGLVSPLIILLTTISYSRSPSGTTIQSPVTYTISFSDSDVPASCGGNAKYWAFLTYNDQYGTGYCGDHCFLSETFPVSEKSKTFALDLEPGVYDFWQIDFSSVTPITDTQEQPPGLCGAIPPGQGADHFTVVPTELLKETFIRTTGNPVNESANFSSPNAGAAVLTIENNGVSSAIITLNGQAVATPDQFKLKSPLLTIPITVLAENNLLQVELRSDPGSFLVVTIK